jgi:hypothetical protein
MEQTQEPKRLHRQLALLLADRMKGGQNSGKDFPNAWSDGEWHSALPVAQVKTITPIANTTEHFL